MCCLLFYSLPRNVVFEFFMWSSQFVKVNCKKYINLDSFAVYPLYFNSISSTDDDDYVQRWGKSWKKRERVYYLESLDFNMEEVIDTLIRYVISEECF